MDANANADALPPPLLRALCRRSDRRGLRRLGAHAALLFCAATAVAVCNDTPALAPALWLYGVVLVFLFAPLHETVHRTAFRSRALNDAVAALCGLILLLPAGYFRVYHLAHHRHTADPARDPELTGGGGPQSLGAYLLAVSGLPLWRERVATLSRHALGRVAEPYLRDRPARITREARLHVAAYALLAAGGALYPAFGALLLLYWLLPLLLGQPLLRLLLLAEHRGCRRSADGLQNARTTYTHALVRLLAWNMSYHAEHHRYAAVPFFALPRLHALVAHRVAFRARGYRSFHRTLLAGLAYPDRAAGRPSADGGAF